MQTLVAPASFVAHLASLALVLALAREQGAAPAQAAAKPAPDARQVLRTVAVGGEGSWDYLTIDPATRRLYVTRSTHVMVLDADTDAVVGDIADTAGVHGVALAPDLGRGFTSNGKAASATIFDAKTLAPLGTVATGEGPDAILYDAQTKRVFTFNGRGKSTTAIDAAAGTAIGTVELGGKPESGVADGAGHVFVNIEDKSEVVVLDPRTLKVTSRWPLAPGEEPTGLAIDRASRRLFVGCRNRKLIVMDADNGKIVAALDIGEGVDATAFDPATGMAYSSNGDGTLTVVHEDDPATFRVVENVPTARGARTMALDPKTHAVYLAAAKYGEPKETPDGKRARPEMVPGSFVILVVGK